MSKSKDVVKKDFVEGLGTAPGHFLMEHERTWVKVNAVVDAGIAEIVAELGQYRHLQTLESCQGGKTEDGVEHPAWVCFRYGDYWESPWRAASEFVLGVLGPELAGKVGDGASVLLRVVPDGSVDCELAVRPGAFEETARALRDIRSRYAL